MVTMTGETAGAGERSSSRDASAYSVPTSARGGSHWRMKRSDHIRFWRRYTEERARAILWFRACLPLILLSQLDVGAELAQHQAGHPPRRVSDVTS